LIKALGGGFDVTGTPLAPPAVASETQPVSSSTAQ